VDSRAAGGPCCDSCESEGGSSGLVSGSEPSAAAFLLRKKELPALMKEFPNFVRLGLAAMIELTVGDCTALSMSIDCLRETYVRRREINRSRKVISY
jgi:hypothetical protein